VRGSHNTAVTGGLRERCGLNGPKSLPQHKSSRFRDTKTEKLLNRSPLHFEAFDRGWNGTGELDEFQKTWVILWSQIPKQKKDCELPNS